MKSTGSDLEYLSKVYEFVNTSISTHLSFNSISNTWCSQAHTVNKHSMLLVYVSAG